MKHKIGISYLAMCSYAQKNLEQTSKAKKENVSM